MNKPEVSFYEILSDNLEKNICILLDKCYLTERNTLVKFSNETTLELINKTLWTYSQKTFVPHGSINDLMPEKQPILLTTEENNINNAQNLVLIAEDFEDVSNFEKVLIIFSDRSNEEREKCRDLYKKYKQSYQVSYYKQNEKGGWDNKA